MRRKPRPNGKFIALRDVESEYSIPYHKVWRWVDRGLIPRLSREVTGESIYIKRADLDAFLNANMTGAAS